MFHFFYFLFLFLLEKMSDQSWTLIKNVNIALEMENERKNFKLVIQKGAAAQVSWGRWSWWKWWWTTILTANTSHERAPHKGDGERKKNLSLISGFCLSASYIEHFIKSSPHFDMVNWYGFVILQRGKQSFSEVRCPT